MASILSRNPTLIPEPESRRFRCGDLVEVASKEEGFVGSYYEAKVVRDLSENGYMVQYRTLLKDDMSAPLREVATAEEVRPRPPDKRAEEYRLHDVVDAFDNDGWWWGWISGRSGDGYTVVFETSRNVIVYPKRRLRIHQEWSNGRWQEATLVRVDH